MLTTEEISKKVRELEIKSKKITTHLFTGEYHSAFKGKGMSFREVREYYAGDDVRFIDWNVSARFSHPFTKVFEEERELTVMLLIDTSASNLFGTVAKQKKELITEIAAVLTFSAINNNDKVGVIFFSDKIDKYIAPKKGRKHALYIVRELLTVQATKKGTDLDEAIKFFTRATKQRSIAFILSDFLTTGYDDDLKVIGNKHDVIGIRVYDKMDLQLPAAGLLHVQDAETGKSRWIDSSDEMVRYNYQQHFMQQSEMSKNFFRKAGAELLHVRTDDDFVKILQQFFIKRT
ncbi:MAG: DUF58 domain-containing protein [Ferruginibacter sp.]|nr:DUF58 domain-containing protein [Bacteroidota bacterium]MBX2919022.1 DUF58 domain-containing protein [Ferruginibacter sp.]MCC7379706.1 DUF58 domain-containing protein [Chitinophagaceae bacterium]